MVFNAKVGATENLAHGIRGRGLLESIRTGFIENGGNIPVEGQGIGTKELDTRGSTLKGIAKAIHDFVVSKKLKLTSKDKSVQEPLGYLISKIAGITNGDEVFIPYAGRGSIARYIDANVSKTIMNKDLETSGHMALVASNPNTKVETEKDFMLDVRENRKYDVILIDGKSVTPTDENDNAPMGEITSDVIGS